MSPKPGGIILVTAVWLSMATNCSEGTDEDGGKGALLSTPGKE